MNYYLDTYAIIEIINGNKNYSRFLGESFSTSIFNLYELYYSLLRVYNKETAEKYFLRFKKVLINFNDNHIFMASELKLKYKKRGLSYTDCLGYVISKEKEIKFLTGDQEFKDLENVEYVK
jgi:predicted nucleic acid-binding protein